MAISTYITSIETSRNTIRNKLVELGLAASSAKLDALATVIEDIVNRGAVSVEIKEGTSYTIPAGYHNGSGTVKAISDITGDAETYKTQTKAVTPTKKQQNVTPDSGYYALSAVTVAAIPEAYQDVSSVNAAAENVLSGKIIVLADGAVVAGTMPNLGAVSGTVSATTVSYTIPKGYHDGTGTVKLTVETKTVTPTKSKHEITPTSGKVLSKVTVNPIPDEYIILPTLTNPGGAPHLLTGTQLIDQDGQIVDGTLPRRSLTSDHIEISGTPAKLSATVELNPGYYPPNSKATVSTSFPTQSGVTFTPSKSQQSISGSKWLTGNIIVEPIPDKYQDVSGVTTTAPNVLDGTYFVDAAGALVEGSMPDRGTVNATIDGLTTTSYTIPAGKHSGTGKVSLTNDIEEALAAI